MLSKYILLLVTACLTFSIITYTPTVKADIIVPTCKPYRDDGSLLQKLLDHPDFSSLKSWGNYKLKSLGCTVDFSEGSKDKVRFTGYYSTPKSLSKFGISYLVGFENQPSIATDGTAVKLDSESILPSHIAKTIAAVETNSRINEFVNTFGADDAYIGSGFIIYRNKGSNYDIGCGRYCKTGLAYSIENKMDYYSLPLNRNYQSFPEVKPALEKIRTLLPSGCSIDVNGNIIGNKGWDFAFPVTSKNCILDHREKNLALATFQGAVMEGNNWERSWTQRFEYLMDATSKANKPPILTPLTPLVKPPSLWSQIVSFLRNLF